MVKYIYILNVAVGLQDSKEIRLTPFTKGGTPIFPLFERESEGYFIDSEKLHVDHFHFCRIILFF